MRTCTCPLVCHLCPPPATLALPSGYKVRAVLERLGGKRARLLWVSMREEPFVYIDGKPVRVHRARAFLPRPENDCPLCWVGWMASL